MPCEHRVQAYQCSDGSVKFSEVGKNDFVRSLQLACGQCQWCRLERSRQWAVRIMHEASLSDVNAFVTLTYSDEFLPSYGHLVYRDFQLFMKRLRKARVGSVVRFYMCGEYTTDNFRPHFHSCLFNVGFPDREYLMKSPSGFPLYRSSELERLWPNGFSSIGDLTFESAGYVARYCLKKVTGINSEGFYSSVDGVTGEIISGVPEFCHMSLRPGIGANWLRLYWPEVIQNGEVVMNGKVMSAPRAYMRKLRKLDGYSEIELKRDKAARSAFEDNSDERIVVKAKVLAARVNQLKRSLR